MGRGFQPEDRRRVYRGVPELPLNNAFIDLYVSYTEDLELFRELYRESGDDLAVFFERQKGAVRSRLKKLGLT